MAIGRLQPHEGFTLIELLIAIAIVGLLAAIAIPNFLRYQERGYNAAAESEAKNFYNAALSYAGDNAESGTVTFSGSRLPKGFFANRNIIYTGTFTVPPDGETVSTMTFRHTKSAVVYTLSREGALTSG